MRAAIRDPGVLESITPMELSAYLRGRGWALADGIAGRFSLWRTTLEGRGEFEVLVPSDVRLRDYRLRLSTALSVLETAEERSQLAIAKDLNQATADVVRFRLAADEAEAGEVPIDYGLRLLQSARDAMLAAACAVVEPRPVYHTRKPAAATAYLARLQLGQTEVGSFVVMLLSKVPPALHADEAGQLFEAPDEPFNRRVVDGLYTALSTARDVAESVQTSGELAPFRSAVEAGVSANLCTALSSLGTELDVDGIDVSFTWAPSRPPRHILSPVVRFSPDNLTILDEAARWLKDLGNVEDYPLYGTVVRLESEDAEEGTIVVAGLVDGSPRRVHIELSRPWYALAIRAHAEHILVRATGDIYKQGRRWTMPSPQSFSIPDLQDD